MILHCSVCNKEVEVPKSRVDKFKTCSLKCLGAFNARNTDRKVTKTCVVCKTEYKVKRHEADKSKYCSQKCLNENKKEMYSGEGNPNYGNTKELAATWKGGRKISNYGYILLFNPEHPQSRSDGYVLEHRYVMSEHLGRLLLDSEIVHHKDGNKQNNDISNLELTTLSEHTTEHNKEKEIVRDKRTGRIKQVILKGGN